MTASRKYLKAEASRLADELLQLPGVESVYGRISEETRRHLETRLLEALQAAGGVTRRKTRKAKIDYEAILQETKEKTIQWKESGTNVHLARRGRQLLMLEYYKGWYTLSVFNAKLEKIDYLGDTEGTEQTLSRKLQMAIFENSGRS